MKAFLLRHGIAEDGADDFNRNLSLEGRQEIKKLARFVNHHFKLTVVEIIHSGLIRAKQTADIFAEEIKPVKGVYEGRALDPMADPNVWAKKLSGSGHDIMLVGHNPHLTRLAAILTSKNDEQEIIKIKKGSLICLQPNNDDGWSILWTLYPGLIK
ncbi:MAG: phosphohistidine phosphatase SixA [Candidatus Margulisbacteria bacterium]|nr:phosphohistidine phosphatase SixA [Candidatus Margulisiibacteriota bacterium]